jgi:hypothetical protein
LRTIQKELGELDDEEELAGEYDQKLKKLKVKNSCLRAENILDFNLSFHLKYKKDSYDQIYRVYCTLKENKCSGVLIKNKDDVIDMNDVVSLQEVSVVKYDENMVQLKWGTIVTFTYQDEKVELVEKSINETAKTEASCK